MIYLKTIKNYYDNNNIFSGLHRSSETDQTTWQVINNTINPTNGKT